MDVSQEINHQAVVEAAPEYDKRHIRDLQNQRYRRSSVYQKHVVQKATTFSFSYVIAFYTRSTAEYPLCVNWPQYLHAGRTMLRYSSELTITLMLLLDACSSNTRRLQTTSNLLDCNVQLYKGDSQSTNP